MFTTTITLEELMMTHLNFSVDMDLLKDSVLNSNMEAVVKSSVVLVLNAYMENERDQSTFPAFSWIGLTNKEGKVVASTDSLLKGEDISARPVYFEALENPFVGDVHEAVLLADLLPNPSGEAMKFVDISTLVYDHNNNYNGVLATHLSWEWISEIESAMLDSIKTQESIEFLIVSKKDNSVIIGPDKLIGEKIDLESIDLAQTRKNGWMIETWPDGKEYMTGYILEDGYKEYPGLGWTILVRQPLEVAYAPIKELLTFFLITGIILALLFAVLGWFLAGRIASPLNDIAKIADRLRTGESVQIPHYRGLLEIEILSNFLCITPYYVNEQIERSIEFQEYIFFLECREVVDEETQKLHIKERLGDQGAERYPIDTRVAEILYPLCKKNDSECFKQALSLYKSFLKEMLLRMMKITRIEMELKEGDIPFGYFCFEIISG